MPDNYQLSLDDMAFMQCVSKQPGRIAYIDECGGYGFDFSKERTAKFYILTAVVVENDKVDKLHADFEEIKRTNGLSNTEVKSSSLSDNRRSRMMSQLLPIEFRIVVFIADKQKFHENTPLTDYKPVFIKNMNSRMHSMLYHAYPKLKILMDETGWPEFRESFKKYVIDHRGQTNLFNEYDFDFINSKDEILVQLADLISGSIMKSLIDPSSPNYLEMLRGKITAERRFPEEYEPYWDSTKTKDYKYDSTIYSLAVKCARDFIAANENEKSDEKQAQVAALRYLLFYVSSVSSTRYVYSDELIRNMEQNVGRRIKKDYLFRRVIAPLRDSGVILASCVHGYKIPISVEDIMTYLNQTTSTVGPMLHRMGICRNLIRQGTDNALDVFNDEEFIRYKNYFEG